MATRAEKGMTSKVCGFCKQLIRWWQWEYTYNPIDIKFGLIHDKCFVDACRYAAEKGRLNMSKYKREEFIKEQHKRGNDKYGVFRMGSVNL